MVLIEGVVGVEEGQVGRPCPSEPGVARGGDPSGSRMPDHFEREGHLGLIEDPGGGVGAAVIDDHDVGVLIGGPGEPPQELWKVLFPVVDGDDDAEPLNHRPASDRCSPDRWWSPRPQAMGTVSDACPLLEERRPDV